MTKPTVCVDALERELRRRVGAISALRPLAEGEESRAFAFDRGCEACVVRVNRSADGFEKDAYVQRFAWAELPLPEILAIGRLDDGLAYCVSRRAAGVTLQDLPREELPPLLPAVMRVLDAIAACGLRGTRGFGRFDAAGSGSDASWRDFLAAIADPQRYDWTAVADRLDLRVLQRLLDRVAAAAAGCANVRHLVHGDFGSNNVLVADGRISAVIDWSEALYGDPLYDVANILFWRPWLDCMEHQARYFKARRPEWLDDGERLQCYQLRIGLEQIWQTAVAGAKDDLAWAVARCLRIAQA